MDYTNSYNNDNAIFMAEMCKKAYDLLNPWAVVVLPSGWEMVRELEASALGASAEKIGFIARRGTDVMVVFRGTVTEAEWQADAFMVQTNYDPPGTSGRGKVHVGFYQTFLSCSGQILDGLKPYLTGHTIYVAGHSLGAALAVLLASYLKLTNKNIPVSMYNFGCPRVGNPDFVNQYNSLIQSSWRVVNKYDPVPKIPDTSVNIGGHSYTYEHVQNDHGINNPTPNFHDIDLYIQGLEA